MLPGWQGIALAGGDEGAGAGPGRFALRIAVGAAVMRAAGCAYNDIIDRDIDARVSAHRRLRPIPSGQISVKQALGLRRSSAALIGLAILLTMNIIAIGLGVLSLGLVAAYPFMKRITWWPQAWLGLTFNWGVLLGYAAVEGGIGSAPLLLYVSGIFWTLGYDTIYALQDIEDDALAGVKSSARRLGSHVRRGVAIFYALAAVFAVAAGWTGGLGFPFLMFAAVFAAHLAWQVVRLKPTDAANALALFRSNRTAGLILALAFALGAWRG